MDPTFLLTNGNLLMDRSLKKTKQGSSKFFIGAQFYSNLYYFSKDNPPITNPPPSNKNSSVESVDLLSLPSSSSSQSTLTNFGSDSVEVVDYSVSKSVSNVNTDYELSSPDCKSPDSVEIITDEDEIKKDDSPPITVAPGRIHQLSTSKSSNDPDTELLSNSGNTLTLSESDSFYEVSPFESKHFRYYIFYF